MVVEYKSGELFAVVLCNSQVTYLDVELSAFLFFQKMAYFEDEYMH
jgi:hypothetical protein